MRNKVLRRMRECGMLLPGEIVYCALSGGTDSAAMTHLLASLRQELEIEVRVCHFNHRLRGDDADGDEAFCRAFARELGLPITVGSADVAAYAKSHGQSAEEAARACRYAFFETLDGKIATAHTADDQMETVLINILRGTGLKGLCGIPPVRGKFIRPLLDVTREETERYLAENGLPHREDATNECDDYLRNRLRHHVTPLLRAENPNWQETLSRMTGLLRQDETLLQALSNRLLQPTKDGGWDVLPLREAERPLRQRALRTILAECRAPKLTSAHVCAVEQMLFDDAGTASIALPGGWIARRSYGTLYLRKGEETTGFSPVWLSCPGEVRIPELSMTVLLTEENVPGSFAIGRSHLRQDVLVRPPLSGDRLTLAGGTKALRRIFTDRKIPQEQRKNTAVAVCGGVVLAAFGIGGNRACAPAPGEKTVYLHFIKNTDKG